MTKVSDSDGCVSWPTFRRWLGMFLGLAILLGAAVAVAAVPVAFADSGPLHSHAADLQATAQSLTEKLGLKVKISASEKGRGTVVVSFRNWAQLEELIDQIGRR